MYNLKKNVNSICLKSELSTKWNKINSAAAHLQHWERRTAWEPLIYSRQINNHLWTFDHVLLGNKKYILTGLKIRVRKHSHLVQKH